MNKHVDVHDRNPFWEIVKGAITPSPTPEQVACQDPKPILLNTVRQPCRFLYAYSSHYLSRAMLIHPTIGLRLLLMFNSCELEIYS